MAILSKGPAAPKLTLRQRMGLAIAGVRGTQSDKEFFKSSRQAAMNTNEPLTNPYRQHSVINACVRAYADNISGVPFAIYTSNGDMAGRERIGVLRKEFDSRRFYTNALGHVVAARDQGDDFRQVLNNDLAVLFDNPDPRLGSSDLFWKAIVTYMMRDGEAVGLMQERDSVATVPREIWAYSGNRFGIKKKLNGMPYTWDFTKDGGSRTEVPDHWLVRPRLLDPDNVLRGLAPYAAGEIGAQTDWYAQLYNRNFFQNGATLGGILMAPPGMTKEQRKAFREAWLETNGGVDKAFGTALATGATDYKEVGTNQRDMQFFNLRKFTREELAMLYRIPLTVLSTYEQVNYANARVQSRAFWQLGLLPVMRWIENIFYSQFFRWVHGGKYWGAFDLSVVEALQEDLAEKLDNAKKYYDMQYPPNQINQRLELGMEELPWGDTYLVNAMLVPAEAAAGVGAEPFAVQQAQAKQAQSTPREPSHSPLLSSAAAHSQQAVSAPLPAGSAAIRISKGQEAQWVGWVDLITPFERRFRTDYKKYLFNLRKKQLTIIAGYEPRSGELAALVRDARQDDAAANLVAESLLFNQEAWDAQLAGATRPIYTDAMIAAGADLSTSIGGSMLFDVTNPAVTQALAKKEVLIKETNTTLRNNLRAQLVQGIANGETANQLQDRVRATFNFQESRSLTIARTEVVQASGFARHQSMVMEGADTHGWLTAMDENVRTDHLNAQDEGMIPINQNFQSTGLLHPGEMGGSAAQIINCRCVEIIGDV